MPEVAGEEAQNRGQGTLFAYFNYFSKQFISQQKPTINGYIPGKGNLEEHHGT